ncbi:hypothetical protein LUZ63_013964 [Rhynchospora breviuscula]|uniref:3'-5' exonuclease domain-containing protein n=1 Tax=Rhynchospora breviuscula TaxID=2022672 RepID=A0A9Q0CA05_9POAL|nr:hypothetical protein LUZ63_013964 [Rhynchospora breviuscula]
MASNSDNISTHYRSYTGRQYNYTIWFFGWNFDVVVTDEPVAVRTWIKRILYIHHRCLNFHQGNNFIAGLGIQWCSFQSNRRPATIQICIGRRVLIFQIRQSRDIPPALSRLFSDSRITFVGYNIRSDCRLLKSYHDLVVSSRAELRSVSGMGNASMERMVETFLGFSGVIKPSWIGNSDWDALMLSVDQVQYAALDAYLSFELGLKLVAGRTLTNRERALHTWGMNYGSDSHSDDSSSIESA